MPVWRGVGQGLHRMWASTVEAGARHPVLFGCGVTCVKTACTDLFVQTTVEGRAWNAIDWRRNLVFASFGLVYLGGVQYAIFVPLFTRILFPNAAKFAAKTLRQKLADRRGQADVLKQVFLDQFVHNPFVLFPTFYALKSVLHGGTIKQGVATFIDNAREDLTACWSVWVPALIVNFTICPMWARVPFVAMVSVGWVAYISFTRGEHTVSGIAAEATDADAASTMAIESSSS